ncbi:MULTISPECIES: flagellar export chaperone FlgN [Pimelobacter]|uniref:flagellar export chaperone FlgN n=1 Tax=Pimelobacter TaxID=2044 RepID=UPI001C04A38C|nr:MULTISPECIES: flagellar export chaperone FlgN [Pimelobacter]MBU2694751.1 flagellar biosynthesis protein FlgN [Pimelobacter sp. 30-1]UUW91962.1 flagellar protein FlgN [Pimelobacter simplex]UUW95789.1 flagellar protein FlgN [Pimelobacter simplex]
MDRLSQILWRERELLELLAYKLEVERLVLASGRTRWLVNATREIEVLLEDLRATEVLRATAADEAAEQLGLTPNPSLAALAEAAEEPWRGILLDHRDALVGVAREIAETSEDAKGLITAGYRSARETLLAIGGTSTASYSAAGAAVADAPRSHLLDRSL